MSSHLQNLYNEIKNHYSFLMNQNDIHMLQDAIPQLGNYLFQNLEIQRKILVFNYISTLPEIKQKDIPDYLKSIVINLPPQYNNSSDSNNSNGSNSRNNTNKTNNTKGVPLPQLTNCTNVDKTNSNKGIQNITGSINSDNSNRCTSNSSTNNNSSSLIKSIDSNNSTNNNSNIIQNTLVKSIPPTTNTTGTTNINSSNSSTNNSNTLIKNMPTTTTTTTTTNTTGSNHANIDNSSTNNIATITTTTTTTPTKTNNNNNNNNSNGQRLLKYRWQWYNDNHWVDYNYECMFDIEMGYTQNDFKFKVDNERFIQFGDMTQRRYDSLTKLRKVQRTEFKPPKYLPNSSNSTPSSPINTPKNISDIKSNTITLVPKNNNNNNNNTNITPIKFTQSPTKQKRDENDLDDDNPITPKKLKMSDITTTTTTTNNSTQSTHISTSPHSHSHSQPVVSLSTQISPNKSKLQSVPLISTHTHSNKEKEAIAKFISKKDSNSNDKIALALKSKFDLINQEFIDYDSVNNFYTKKFYVKGKTDKYYVRVCEEFTCDCYYGKMHNYCKHMAWVMISLLKFSPSHWIVWQTTFTPKELYYILVADDKSPLINAKTRMTGTDITGQVSQLPLPYPTTTTTSTTTTIINTSNSGGNGKKMEWIWQWRGEKNWINYSDTSIMEIEDSFNRKLPKFNVDSERFIQFGDMTQRRVDDPTKQRRVRRTKPNSIPPTPTKQN